MTDISDRLASALADRYAIDRELGAGGMATVYLAHDVKHDRMVAVKVLRPELAAVLGTERFLNEIRVTANLSHPHILPLLDSGQADGGSPAEFLYYVMPFIEGESLRGKLDREKQLSIEESVEITKSVASALDYAHRQNVIHRDIKPANILLHDGQPVVADFGISLAVTAAGGTRLTETGLSLGTPHYMSPEQATGDREVDGKADIYSLGCVLYEMLAGDPPHTGSTVQAIIAATVSSDPKPITERRSTVPNHLAAALHHALEKIPADRFESAGQFADALGSTTTRAIPSVAFGPPDGIWYRRYLPWLVAAVLAIVVAVQMHTGSREEQRLVITSIAPPTGHQFVHQASFALSPDGTQLAFVAISLEGELQLWVRSLDTLHARPLIDVDGEGWPFWSPEGRLLGFFSNESISVIDVVNGSRRDICSSTTFKGGAWSLLDTLVFAAESGIWKAAADGGQCNLLIPDTMDVRRPSFLPDGMRFTYAVGNSGTLKLASLQNAESVELLSWDPSWSRYAPGYVQFAPPGFLVFCSYGIASTSESRDPLSAQEIDLGDYSIDGDAVEIVRSVRAAAGVHSFSVSNDGILAYLVGYPDLPPLEFDRNGTLVSPPLDGPVGRWTFSVAREDSRLFLGGDRDFWILDRSTGTTTLHSTGWASSPVPGPGDSLIAYMAWGEVGESCSIRVHNILQSIDHDLILGPCGFITDWTADGQHLLFDNSLFWFRDTIPNTRIWQYTFADSSVSLLVETAGNAKDGVVSPDGRWLAFSSDETGAPEIYLRRSDARDRGTRISHSGGRWPRWRDNGRELYFISPDGAVHVSDVASVIAGRSPEEPRMLFRHPDWESGVFSDAGTAFSATPDGQRFFLRRRTADANITLVQNWPALLERR